VLGVMLPVITPTHPIATVDVLAIARVVDKIIIDIDRYVVSPPAGSTAPNSTPGRSNRYPDAERQEQAPRVIAGRGIVDRRIGVHRRAVDDGGVIAKLS